MTTAGGSWPPPEVRAPSDVATTVVLEHTRRTPVAASEATSLLLNLLWLALAGVWLCFWYAPPSTGTAVACNAHSTMLVPALLMARSSLSLAANGRRNTTLM